MIDQLTVFLENTTGRLTALCRTLGDAGIQMSSLTVADTTDYGIARIICDDPAAAVTALKRADFRASLTHVVGVKVPDVPGGLAGIFEALEAAGLNVEYGYCFAARNVEGAVAALKVAESGIKVLEDAGFTTIHPSDLA